MPPHQSTSSAKTQSCPSGAGPRLLEEENKIQILKNAIQEGIASGMAKHFDDKKHLETLKANKKKNG